MPQLTLTHAHTHIHAQIPWMTLRHELVQEDSATPHHVLYGSTFDQMSATNNMVAGGSEAMQDVLYKNRSRLEALFRLIDSDNSGEISVDEMRTACTLLKDAYTDNSLFSDDVIEKIIETMDGDKSGNINFNEFLESFRVNLKQT